MILCLPLMEAKRCLECGSKLLGDGRCGPCDLLSWCNKKSSSLVRESLWVEFHPDGEKRSVGAYKKGEPDGLWTYWHGNGQKAVEGAWTEGEPRECGGTGTPTALRRWG